MLDDTEEFVCDDDVNTTSSMKEKKDKAKTLIYLKSEEGISNWDRS